MLNLLCDLAVGLVDATSFISMRAWWTDTDRRVVTVGDDIPLLGNIAFGLIDRGTNIIQVRPTTLCHLSCVFCSTDAGPKSRSRQSEYIVASPDWLLDWIKNLVKIKGEKGVEVHIDTVGDPLTYPELTTLIQGAREIRGVEVISLQTHGPTLTEKLVEDLATSGLDRINLSIDALDEKLVRKLSGTEWYDVGRVIEAAKYALENTKMDILIAPVWVPSMNDEEIPRIIELALKIGAGKRWPPLGIQKYECHKYGRRPRGVKPMRWSEFYAKLNVLSGRYRVKLRLTPNDFRITKRPRAPMLYKVGDVVRAKVVAPGWLRGEMLAVAKDGMRTMTLVGGSPSEGSWVKARVIRNKDGIYIAKAIP